MNKLSRVTTGLAVTGGLLFGAYDYHHNKQPITVEYQELHDLYYKYGFSVICKSYGFIGTKTIKEAEGLLGRMSFKDPKYITKDNPEGIQVLKSGAFDRTEEFVSTIANIRDIDNVEVWTNTKIQCAQIEISLNGLMDNLRERYLYF